MINILKKVKSQNSKVKSVPSTSSGYTLLFAMIVASIVLPLGVSILTISRKEFALSSSATQSTNAFYAADSGIGCAEYWAGDNGGGKFATSSGVSGSNLITEDNGDRHTANQIVCSSDPNSLQVAWSDSPSTTLLPTPIGTAYEFTFYTPFSTDGTSNKSCAKVIVDKYVAQNQSLGAMYTYTSITSRGYN